MTAHPFPRLANVLFLMAATGSGKPAPVTFESFG
jgi:hypothetical protein